MNKTHNQDWKNHFKEINITKYALFGDTER